VGEKRNAYRVFVENTDEKRPPYEARHGIRIDLVGLGVEDVNWIHLAQD
jgi:hypothetical protein